MSRVDSMSCQRRTLLRSTNSRLERPPLVRPSWFKVELIRLVCWAESREKKLCYYGFAISVPKVNSSRKSSNDVASNLAVRRSVAGQFWPRKRTSAVRGGYSVRRNLLAKIISSLSCRFLYPTPFHFSRRRTSGS